MTHPNIYFPDRVALRAWLTENHDSHGPIWLVYDKQAAGRARALLYDDMVEEALCFGWIDSVAGRVSATRAKLYFSPRKRGSVWSALNKRRVASLEDRGLMAPPGRAKVDAAKADGSWIALDAFERLEVPEDLAAALARVAGARANYDAFPPGVRKQILTWVGSAKRAQTRASRIRCVAELAGRNIRALPGAPAAAGLRPKWKNPAGKKKNKKK